MLAIYSRMRGSDTPNLLYVLISKTAKRVQILFMYLVYLCPNVASGLCVCGFAIDKYTKLKMYVYICTLMRFAIRFLYFFLIF